MKLPFLTLLIAALATFRLALMISDDDGPYGIFRKFRQFLDREAKKDVHVRKSELHKGVKCQRCSSVWVATPIAAYVYFAGDLPPWLSITGDVFLLMCALSALAILFNRVPEAK